jgi:hypothetical protein
MNIIPAVSIEDESPSPRVNIYQLAPRPNNMSKPVAALVVVGLFPLFLPVALVWLIFIVASWLTEFWYRALEDLKS